MTIFLGLLVIAYGLYQWVDGYLAAQSAESAFHQIYAAVVSGSGTGLVAAGLLICVLGRLGIILKSIDRSLNALRIEAERHDELDDEKLRSLGGPPTPKGSGGAPPRDAFGALGDGRR